MKRIRRIWHALLMEVLAFVGIALLVGWVTLDSSWSESFATKFGSNPGDSRGDSAAYGEQDLSDEPVQ